MTGWQSSILKMEKSGKKSFIMDLPSCLNLPCLYQLPRLCRLLILLTIQAIQEKYFFTEVPFIHSPKILNTKKFIEACGKVASNAFLDFVFFIIVVSFTMSFSNVLTASNEGAL